MLNSSVYTYSAFPPTLLHDVPFERLVMKHVRNIKSCKVNRLPRNWFKTYKLIKKAIAYSIFWFQ